MPEILIFGIEKKKYKGKTAYLILDDKLPFISGLQRKEPLRTYSLFSFVNSINKSNGEYHFYMKHKD